MLIEGPSHQKENQNVDTRYPGKAFHFILNSKKQSKILSMILDNITDVILQVRVFKESGHCSTFVKRTEN